MDEKEKNIYLGILLAAVLIGIILIYFLLSIIKQHTQKRELQRLNMRNLLKAIEEERMRISNDLHDEVNPLLSAIKFQIASMGDEEVNQRNELPSILNYLDDAISSLKNISQNLMPVMLVRHKVIKAIEEYTQFVNRTQSLTITFNHQTQDEIDSQTGIHVFRIIQEIIQNTIKHSESNDLVIELQVDTKLLTLRTKDTGKGFDTEKIDLMSYGKGLSSIKLRAELLKGTCYIHSKQFKGTEIVIKIPY